MPEVNAHIHGLMVDALWREAQLIVELDGHAAHATPTRVEEDRRRELLLRSDGYTVLRYTWAQVTQDCDQVVSDLRAALAEGDKRRRN
jgi:very-short-patch-repair endonuclease